MLNETKYRKQAMGIWEASREATKVELKQDFDNLIMNLTALGKSLTHLILLKFRRKRHE